MHLLRLNPGLSSEVKFELNYCYLGNRSRGKTRAFSALDVIIFLIEYLLGFSA